MIFIGILALAMLTLIAWGLGKSFETIDRRFDEISEHLERLEKND